MEKPQEYTEKPQEYTEIKTLDIVNMMETQPIIKLTDDYKPLLIQKIAKNFNKRQQQMYITNFSSYVNYHPVNDFVVDFDTVWGWLGYDRKMNAKTLLIKNFKEDVDFVIVNLATANAVARSNHGGHNKEQILLNIRTFKKFCMKSRAEKADEIHDYFVLFEELVHETVMEESHKLTEMVRLGDEKNQELTEELTTKREETLIIDNERKKCVYLGMVTDSIVGFGFTDDIRRRTKEHKTIHIGEHFILEEVFVTNCEKELENAIKKKLKKYIINQKDTEKLVEKGIIKHPQTELIRLNSDFTLEKIKECIKKYRRNLENPDNNNELLNKLEEKDKIIYQQDIRIKQLEQLLREANGEIPVEYKIIKDENLEAEIKQKITFLEFVMNFIFEYENIDKLENCKFYENKKDVLMIEKDDFYNIYEEYIKTNNISEFKFNPSQIANYIPMKSKTITFLHMKTERINRTIDGEKFRPTVRFFYINELKEYIPTKIEELKNTNTETQIKIVKESTKDIKLQTRLRKDQKAREFIKYVLETIPEYLTEIKDEIYRVSIDDLYDNYLKFDIENDLTVNKFGEFLNKIEIVQTKHNKSKSYKKINKALVEQKLQEI